MNIRIRLEDAVRPDDDIVLRAGGGDPDRLTRGALENAAAYQPLVEGGLLRSAYTISVHIARAGRADEAAILRAPPYSLYRPYLSAPASAFLNLGYIDIVPTTIVVAGQVPTLVDLCHFDIVVEAADERQLFERITQIRSQFAKVANPYRSGTVSSGGETNA